MKKKIVSLTLATVLALSTMVGCGDTATTGDTASDNAGVEEGVSEDGAAEGDAEPAPVEDTADVTTAATMEAPAVDGWTDDMKIYYYSWNTEFGDRMGYVLKNHPEYEPYVEYVNLNCSGTDGTYQEGVSQAIASGTKYPSIIAADNDVAKQFLESEDTVALSSIGITEDMYANAYQFTKDYATVDGELKALTWQAAVGSFVYRTDIAEEVLGATTPEEVQEYVKDWDTFFATAETMKAAGYKMLSGCDDIKYACFDQQTQPWITIAEDGTETLTLDSSVTDFFNYSKQLYDGGYTDNSSMWDSTWSANFEDDVFGYFGCTWFVYWCMAFDTNEDGSHPETSTFGKWATCQGPVGYHWGGTYVAVLKDCPNPELAAYLVYALCCDEEVMYDIAANTLDFVNNKAVVAREIEEGVGASDILGGQNPVAVWADAALAVDLSNASYLDSYIKEYITNAAAAYNAGTYASVDEALAAVKADVAAKFDYVVVE